MFRRALVLALLLVVPLAADKKPKGVPLAKRPDQKAEISELTLPKASQPCTSYAWAVAVEAMLKAQSVALDQHFWVQKAVGGELCIEPLPDLDRLARTLNGTYTLDDGRKVTLETVVTAGAATVPDDSIAPLKQGLPVLVFWKARAYVLRGAIYDEYIYPNNQRMFIVRELKMLDPLAAKQTEVSFVNGTDDPADISALIFVRATFVKGPSWQTKTKWQ